ncbi:MAG: hypothetical protein JXB05_12225 [Myxococcaceae bacterium]|nr:hypothetical protein [Myxococcaceae bacterium]
MKRQLLALVLLAAPGVFAAGEAPTHQGSKPTQKQPAAPGAEAVKPGVYPLRPIPNPSRPPFRWDVPGLLDWVDSAGVQISDGVPLSLQLARSKLPIQELIQHFAASFEKAGLFIPPGEQQIQALREPQLTALDTERLVAYTVIFQPNPDKTVTVILGTSDLSRYQPNAGRTTVSWAPVPPGANQLLSNEMEGAQSAIFEVPSTKEQVQAFYQQAMKQLRFVEKAPGEFYRGNEMIRVSIQSKDGRLTVGLLRKLGVKDGAPGP